VSRSEVCPRCGDTVESATFGTHRRMCEREEWILKPMWDHTPGPWVTPHDIAVVRVFIELLIDEVNALKLAQRLEWERESE
jgi:hypothetical protein